MDDLTQLQRDIEWYREGERDSDFVKHLADELLVRNAELEAKPEAADPDDASRIDRALEHNCSNVFCSIREDDYPNVVIP